MWVFHDSLIVKSLIAYFKGAALPDVEQLVEALKTEKVEAILVDMYTPAKRKDLFNGSWFEVSKLLKTDISQGVVLQGAALNLADELYKSVLEQNVQTQYLLEVKEKGENSAVSKRLHYNLGSP